MDFVLASFPRSGSLWLREMLRDIYSPGETLTSFSPVVEPDSPNTVQNGSPGEVGRLRVLKTHLRHDCLMGEYNPAGIIVLFRDPIKAGRSVFEKKSRLRPEEIMQVSVDDFVQRAARNWIGFHQTYIDAADRGQNIRFVAYERMCEHTSAVLGEICGFLGHEPIESLETVAARRAVKPSANVDPRRGDPANRPNISEETRTQIERDAGSIKEDLWSRLTKVDSSVG